MAQPTKNISARIPLSLYMDMVAECRKLGIPVSDYVLERLYRPSKARKPSPTPPANGEKLKQLTGELKAVEKELQTTKRKLQLAEKGAKAKQVLSDQIKANGGDPDAVYVRVRTASSFAKAATGIDIRSASSLAVGQVALSADGNVGVYRLSSKTYWVVERHKLKG